MSLPADERGDRPERDEQLIVTLAERLDPVLRWYFRLRVEGVETVPEEPCLFVGNHNGGMLMPDMYLLGMVLYRRFGLAGVPWGLAHRFAMGVPLVGHTLRRLGAVPGCQDSGLRLLAEGRNVVVYPGGELDSMRSHRERDRVCFGQRRGYLKLALRAGVPVVPVVTAGAHETLWVLNDGRRLARRLGIHRWLGLSAFPLTLSLPWGLWLGIPPPHFPLPTRIQVTLLPPIRFERSGEAAAADAAYVETCHTELHRRMEQELQRLTHQRR